MNATPAIDPAKAAGIRALFEAMPQDYTSRYAALTAITHIFHQEMGQALQPALAEQAKQLQSMNLAQRRQWISDCNEALRRLHLAIACPKTGRPAILIADSKDADESYLRYRLQVYDGGRSIRTYTSRELPPLEIIEDDSRVENLAHQGRGVGRSGPSR